MASRDVIHEAVLQLRADTTQLRSDLAAGRGMFEGSLKGMQGLARSLVPVLSIGGFAAFGKSVIDLGGQLQDLHEQTGISVRSLSGIKSTLEENGSSMDAFAKGVFNLQKNLGNVDDEGDLAAKAIKHLGLNLNDLRNSTPDEFIKKVIDALGNIKNPLERNTVLFNLLGKSARELGPAFQALNGRFDELSAKGLSPEQVKRLDDIGDSLTRLKNALLLWGAGPVVDALEAVAKLFGIIALAPIEKLGKASFELEAASKALAGLQGKSLAQVNAMTEEELKKLAESPARVGRLAKAIIDAKAQIAAANTALRQPEIVKPPPPKPLPTKANLEETKRILAEGLKDMFAGIDEAKAKAIAGGQDMIDVFGDLDTEAMTPLEHTLGEINKRFDEMKMKASAAFEAAGVEPEDAAARLKRLDFFKSQALLAAKTPTTGSELLDAEEGQRFSDTQQRFRDLGLAARDFGTEMDLINSQAAVFGASFDSIGAKISTVTSEINRLLQQGLQPANADIQQLKTQLDGLKNLQAVESSFDSLLNGIAQSLAGARMGTQSFAEALKNTLANAFSSLSENMLKAGLEPLKKQLSGFLQTSFPSIFGGLGALSGGGAGATLQSGAMQFQAAVTQFAAAVAAMPGALGVGGLFGGGSGVADPGQFLGSPKIGEGFQGLGGGFDLSGMMSGITEKLSSMMSGLMDTLSSALSGLGDMFSSMFSGIGSFIMGMFDKGGFVGLGGLPSFDKGGLVAAGLAGLLALPSFASGGAVPILAHPGELVLSNPQVQSLRQGAVLQKNITGNLPAGGGQAGGPIHLHITHDYTNAVAPSDLKTKRKEVETYIIENWRKGGAVRTMIMGDKGHR